MAPAASASVPILVFGSGKPFEVAIPSTGKQVSKLRVEIVKRGSGRVVKGFIREVRSRKREGERHRANQMWAGRTWSGAVAPAGDYRVRLSAWRTGEGWTGPIYGRKFKFRTHVFPVAGDHGIRGAVGEFGAGRSGGRIHQGFDITAPCGRKLLAARAGRVTEVGYDPILYGHYLALRGAGELYSYFYSHLMETPPVRAGRRLRTGAVVGAIGQTGNAATTPCHLHFEIRRRGVSLDPAPFLEHWSR